MKPAKTKEEFIDNVSHYVSTGVSGFNIEWVKRQLNNAFGDRVMIETDGYELDLDPPRPEPCVPCEPEEDVNTNS